jgi:digeranylgeranylglycerophospholipid reductase
MRTEAAVIGAGPAGLIAAEVISSKGFNTTVFEEHRQVGSPDHCAGIISVEGFERLGIPLDDSFYLNTICGGRLYSADGTCLEIRDRKPRAHIIDRGEFDRYLAQLAVDSGVDLRTCTHVNEIVSTKKGVVGLKTSDYSVRSSVLINSEGAKGRLLSKAGIVTGQEGVFNGYNVDIPGIRVEQDMVEVWFNDEVSNDFFAWVVPVNEDKVRVGLGSSNPEGYSALRKFIKNRFGEVDIPPIHAGLVCTGGPVKKTSYPGMLLVGDVAGQVKPTTAGGIVIGGLCAGIAGKAASNYLEKGTRSELDWYDREWRQLYGNELSTMQTLRGMLNGVGDDRLNRMFRALNKEGMGAKLTKLVAEGDMDMQAEVIKRAFADPSMVAIMARVVGRVVLGEVLSFFGF